MFTKARGVPAAMRAIVAVLVVAAAMLALAACGSDDKSDTGTAASTAASTTASTTDAAATGFKPVETGKLTVGMNLQFKPEMYLDNGEPAGYDVELLKKLAPALGAELNIQNLDFNG